jgi:asparagine synthase (glutamine-hydrolysing)
MCAIVGWQFSPGAEPASDVLARMAEVLNHRGPDDSGEHRDPSAGLALAQRRLSIIDLSADSHQPMVDSARGVVLIYNGELYNFRELRRELKERGHIFRSQGDTEVVLRSYIEWGCECFARFAGMFALAIWDQRSAILHLARDAMGMKPLYYMQPPQGLVFASELKAFRELPGFDAEVDPASLQQYMEFGYVFDEQRTMLQGVRKLAPGHRLEVRAGQVIGNVPWFTPPSPDLADASDEEARVHELGQVMTQVVREHLIADVPVGLLLSGGLDSSVVAALAAREGPLLTISMGFENSVVDERAHARSVSEFIGSRHVEVSISAMEVEREARAGAWVFDDLFADWGTITTRLLYRRCREQGVKVVLVGEGADELFGGYDIFKVPPRLGLWRQFRLYQKYAGRRHGRLFRQFHAIMGNYLEASAGDAFNAVRLFETRRQLPNNYVMKVDKASMAESVEARAPYLDRRVAELAYRTPASWLLRNGENKYLLRSFARRDALLPAAISGREKFGASIAAGWMNDSASFRRFARERVIEGAWCSKLGLAPAMKRFFDHGRSGDRVPGALSIYSNVAWRVLLLELWASYYAPS